jgi:hypothetical protein
VKTRQFESLNLVGKVTGDATLLRGCKTAKVIRLYR